MGILRTAAVVACVLHPGELFEQLFVLLLNLGDDGALLCGGTGDLVRLGALLRTLCLKKMELCPLQRAAAHARIARRSSRRLLAS